LTPKLSPVDWVERQEEIMKAFTLVLAIALSATGCSAIKSAEHKLDSLSDDQLAQYLEEGSKAAAKYGIQAANRKFPGRAAQIKADFQVVDDAIRKVVLPALAGAPTAQVLGQVVQTVTDKLKNTTLDNYEVYVQTILLSVPLPANPADKLSARSVKGIQAFFMGIVEGGEEAEGIAPPPTPAPTPGPAPTPPPNK
jgi:hypothetical protein